MGEQSRRVQTSRVAYSAWARVKQFYEQVGIDPSDGIRGRAAETFALVAIAGALAVKFKVLPESYEPYKVAQEC